MKWTSSLLLILSINFITACDLFKQEVIAVPDISWYTPVKFSEDTWKWLDAANPPQCVLSDLDVARKNNLKYEAIKENAGE